MKELNERQRAEHAVNIYEQQKSLLHNMESRNKELEDKFSEVNLKHKFAYFSKSQPITTRPRSAVGNMSGNRCESDCRYWGREFDCSPVPYFRGD